MRYLSLFSGMEAAHIAWAPLGWECAGVAEIEPAACALLRHRLPNVPNLGDVSKVTGEAIAKLGRIDVVIGGSPCQDLSVAGKRTGLSGSRSSLFHEQLRIFNAARTLCGARWLVWENVPGAFSSNKGRDFAVVAGAMAGCQLAVPAEGWGNEGVALGDSGLVEWSVLDSQWFGVAQRRRRVFAVLDTGDWANRPPVLLESDRLRGDSAPCREAGEGVTGTLSARTSGGGGLGTDFEVAGGLVPQLARCDTTGEGGRLDGESCTFIPEVAGCLNSSGGHAYPGTTSQDAMAGGFMIPEVAHTLRADGFDASEDGTGRGTPLVPVVEPYTLAIRGRGDESVLEFRQDGTANALLTPSGGRCGINVGAIAFYCKASGQAGFGVGEIASTMRSMGHADSHQNGGGHLAVAIRTAQTGSNGWGVNTDGVDYTLDSAQQAVASVMAVRRLTPMECERLQAAPDNWTLVPNANGKPMADGPRYKMLGNSFTTTVIRWIGRQIEVAHQAQLRSAA